MRPEAAPVRRALGRAITLIDAQQGRLFLWLPVLVSVGIGVFFGLSNEPMWAQYRLVIVVAVALGFVATKLPSDLRAPVLALLAVLAGFLAAGARTHSVAAPVLGFRYYGPVEGRVVTIDRSASDAVRLTLDQIELEDVYPDRTPARVRISFHGEMPERPLPGARVTTIGHLSPPPGPTEPGGFDFQRMAWFDRLGAVGYSRNDLNILSPPEKGLALAIHRLRQFLADAIRSKMDGQEGAFAAAILTGDRSAITHETEEALRGSNLSHLLAISGLHMGLMTGVVFAASRFALALSSRATLFLPIKKIAAVVALCSGLFYLSLSGWSVATERAYIMVGVMYVAILLDRQAISLRAVALAAMIILALRPEVLAEPGFQMSFAATTALVAVFASDRVRGFLRWCPWWLRISLGIVLTSAVAGAATAPVAAAHFNRISDWGLVANVVSVPLMGAVIMPAAIVAALLAPIGLSDIPLGVMGWAIHWILTVAETVSGWEGAVSHVVSPSASVLPLMALGGLFVILWRGRARYAGFLPILIGVWMWSEATRPPVLISERGDLLGVMTQEGRALSKASGAGFAARTWLENDGDAADQIAAADRPMPELHFGAVRVAHITGRGWEERARAACDDNDIVVVNQTVVWDGPCTYFDTRFLRQSGSVAIFPVANGVQVETAYGQAGVRIWNTFRLRLWNARAPQALRVDLDPRVTGFTLTRGDDAWRFAGRLLPNEAGPE